jgi:hypothetical protein
MDKTAGHAFISYVREDTHEVDKLQRILEAAGVSVWRDTADLWPGEDWRLKIRQAITGNALIFIVCFSSRSVVRRKSYQNEELMLAIDQLRLRRPDDPWLIPVRFDDCVIPDVGIGGDRTLASIQRVDLYGDYRETGIARLMATVLRILGQSIESEARQTFKTQADVIAVTGASSITPSETDLRSYQHGYKAASETPDAMTWEPTTDLPEASGESSKVVRINIPSGRYVLSWVTQGTGNYFSVRDESEKNGKGVSLCSALGSELNSGEKIVRLEESGDHVLSVDARNRSWNFKFRPI